MTTKSAITPMTIINLKGRQAELLKHLISLGPVGDVVDATHSKAMSKGINISSDTYRFTLQRLQTLGFISMTTSSQGTKVIVLQTQPTKEHMLTKSQRKLLDSLVDRYPMNALQIINETDLFIELEFANVATLRRYLSTLQEAGALEITRANTEMRLTLKKRAEEFLLSGGVAPIEDKRPSLVSTEIKRLSAKIEELTNKLYQYQTAPIAAYLYRPRFETEWKDAVLIPPTKDDLVNLEFKALRDHSVVEADEENLWVHLKSNREYEVIGTAQLEETNELGYIYRALEDGSVWCRKASVFLDGRFMKKSDYQEMVAQTIKRLKKA